MGVPTEEFNRAGWKVVGGKLVRINNANRHVREAGNEAAPDHAGVDRENPQLQKQQDVDKAVSEDAAGSVEPGGHRADSGLGDGVGQEAHPDDYQAGVSADDGRDDCQHRVTIVVRFSNRLRTDLSGKLDTILDCLVRARRRLLDKAAGNYDPSRTVRAGKRGSNNRDRAAVKQKLPF